jgi:hypothetical protein
MFTIGRDREKEHSNRYLSNAAYRPYIHRVIDAVHDCLEGSYDPNEVRRAFTEAFNDGGSGVWEQTGSWLAKLTREFPEFSDICRDLSQNKDSKLRFRAAAFLENIPEEYFWDMLQAFSIDKSKSIRSKVAGDFGVENCVVHPRILSFLLEWREREKAKEVIDAIDFAISHQKRHNKPAHTTPDPP